MRSNRFLIRGFQGAVCAIEHMQWRDAQYLRAWSPRNDSRLQEDTGIAWISWQTLTPPSSVWSTSDISTAKGHTIHYFIPYYTPYYPTTASQHIIKYITQSTHIHHPTSLKNIIARRSDSFFRYPFATIRYVHRAPPEDNPWRKLFNQNGIILKIYDYKLYFKTQWINYKEKIKVKGISMSNKRGCETKTNYIQCVYLISIGKFVSSEVSIHLWLSSNSIFL